MGRAGKILLLVATLWPLLYMGLFFGFIFSMMLSMPQSGGSTPPGMSGFFPGIFMLHMLTILWCFALAAIYLVNVFRNDRVAEDRKVLWAVVILLGGFFAMPVYWYLYIWPDVPAPVAQRPPAE